MRNQRGQHALLRVDAQPPGVDLFAHADFKPPQGLDDPSSEVGEAPYACRRLHAHVLDHVLHRRGEVNWALGLEQEVLPIV